jgi:hypothetical protein
LLSSDDWRAALLNEVPEDGPEVSVVVGSLALTGGAEGLAREAGCPERTFPSGHLSGKLPSCNPCKKVAYVIS